MPTDRAEEPVFLTPRDAEITTKIYERHPVLVQHDRENGNPWGVRFHTRLFHSAEDSELFREFDGQDEATWAPLYEAKMFHHFTHRWATYRDGSVESLALEQLQDPAREVTPRWVVPASEVARRLQSNEWSEDLLLTWRDICRSTDMRTCIASLLPRSGVTDKCLLAFPSGGVAAALTLATVWSAFAFDFIVRQKMSSTQLKLFTFTQLPVLPPAAFAMPAPWGGPITLHEWVAVRGGALFAASWRMASVLGYQQPCRWDEDRREAWRVELDAAMFHLFGYSREELAYVMDTFPIVARTDRQKESLSEGDPNWRTKRLVLNKYDELARHATAGTTYESPDPPPPLPAKLRLHHEA